MSRARYGIARIAAKRRHSAVLVLTGLLALPGLASSASEKTAGVEAIHDLKPAEVEIIEPLSGAMDLYEGAVSLPVPEGPDAVVNPGRTPRKEPRGTPEKPDQSVPLRSRTKTLVRSFAGLDHAASVGSDGLYRPPDTTLGKNSTHVLEATNSAIRLMTLAGATVATKSLNSFFSSDPAADLVLFDPRVVYDRLGPNQRYFVVALQRNNNVQTASILLAVSKSANPSNLETTDWCRYRINSVRDSPATWADYPMVGVGPDSFLISNDQWSFPPYQYKYGVLRVFNKTTLTNNAASCPAMSVSLFVLPGTTGTSQVLGHVQPAIHYTATTSFANRTNPAYMVSTVTPSSTYRIWRVANAATASPTVDVINITASSPYATPPPVKQPGVAATLNPKDNRVMQVAARGDTLWAVHASSCGTSFGTTKACIRALRLFASESGGAMTALVQQDLTFASPDTAADAELSYFMPGIAFNANSDVGVVFLASGPNQYLSSAYTTKGYFEPFFYGATLFNTGSCARTVSRLAGDYVGAQTNPDDSTSFWSRRRAPCSPAATVPGTPGLWR